MNTQQFTLFLSSPLADIDLFLSSGSSFQVHNVSSVPLWHWDSLLPSHQAEVQILLEMLKGVKKKDKEITDCRREEGIMYEVRRVDIWTDTVQQTGNWEDIWRIHQAVMKLFGFFYKTTRVSLMDKVGAGKHISVMAQHCRRKKNKLSSHISHPLNPCLSLRLNYSFLAALVFNLCLSLHAVFLHPSVILPCHPVQGTPPPPFTLRCIKKWKNRAICEGTANGITLPMFPLRHSSRPGHSGC